VINLRRGIVLVLDSNRGCSFRAGANCTEIRLWAAAVVGDDANGGITIDSNAQTFVSPFLRILTLTDAAMLQPRTSGSF